MILVVVGFLSFVAIVFLFRPQVYVLLNRLAKMEFHVSGNILTKTDTITPKDAKPWSWHKAWINTLLHPNDETWSRLLSENNISFKIAYAWITITSLLFPLVYSIVAWIKYPPPLATADNILNPIKTALLIGVLEPIGILGSTGAIHILAKLFLGKGSYKNFFVVFATAYMPITLLYTILALVRWAFASKLWLYAGLLLNFYFVSFVCTEIITFNYRANLPKAFLINVVVTALASFLAYWIYCATGFGI
jgi:hypothetical protein